MANLIIKPTSGGLLKLQEDGGTDAISIGTDGKSTITNAVITAWTPPAGAVIQVVQLHLTSTQTKQSASTATWYDIPSFTKSITPSATSSKVLVTAVINLGIDDGDACAVKLVRGSTDLNIGDAAGNRTRASGEVRSNAASQDYGMQQLSINYLDSPSSTSAVAYKFQWMSPYSSEHLYLNRTWQDNDVADRVRTASTITLMEIAG